MMTEFKKGDRIRRINPHPIVRNGETMNSWDSHEFGIVTRDTTGNESYVYFLPDSHLTPEIDCDCICSGGPAGGMLKKDYVLMSTPDLPGFTFDD